VVDAMEIFKRREPRNLAAAYQFYCNRSRDDLHSADADVRACAEILEAQLARYPDLPRTPEEIDAAFRSGEPGLDRDGKFGWREGEAVINFGKRRGTPLREVAAFEPDFLEWMIARDFAPDAKEIARRALKGEFPQKP
jgi:DNA polymerase-3 subunit epsilon